MTHWQLYVDLDDVLADYASAYRARFKEEPRRGDINKMFWRAVQDERFFETMPPLPGAIAFWQQLLSLTKEVGQAEPIILSGCPDTMSELVAAQKRVWLTTHLGRDTQAIFCRSREKSQYAKPHAVLIDDYDRHRAQWERAGARFVHHRTYAESFAVAQAHATEIASLDLVQGTAGDAQFVAAAQLVTSLSLARAIRLREAQAEIALLRAEMQAASEALTALPEKVRQMGTSIQNQLMARTALEGLTGKLYGLDSAPPCRQYVSTPARTQRPPH